MSTPKGQPIFEMYSSDLPSSDTIRNLRSLFENRRLLLKRGKIFGRKVFRYFIMRNHLLLYYKNARSHRLQGTRSLLRCKSEKCSSPIKSRVYCIQVITKDRHSNFYIFPECSQEESDLMLYLNLASSGVIGTLLESKNEDTAVSPKDIPTFYIKVPSFKKPTQNRRIKGRVRRLVSPTSEVELDTPQETSAQRIPASNIICGSHNVTIIDNFLEVEDICYEDMLKTEPIHIEQAPEIHQSFISIEEDEFKLPEVTTTESIREAGLKYLWNFELDYSKKCFAMMKNYDLRCALHYAEISLFRVLITGRRADVLQSNEALQEVENLLKTLADPYSEIISAETSLYKGILLLVSGQKLRAFIVMRTAWKTLKRYESSVNSIRDSDIKSRVLFGLGLFSLVVSLVPYSISTILKLAGFAGNKDKGLEMLKQCYTLKGSRSPFVPLILAMYHVDSDPNLELAQTWLDQALAEYPKCVFFHWVKSVVAWKCNRVDMAVCAIQTALLYCGENLAKLAAFLKYELGWFYFLKLEFVKARELFEQILNDTLSLSSELDEFVKEALSKGYLPRNKVTDFNNLFSRRFTPKRKNKGNWVDYPQSPTGKDRVFIPHKACLIAQLAGCHAAQHDNRVIFWLKVTKIAASNPSNSRTKLDEEFGSLSQIFLQRISTDLLPFEVIYFLKQHTKLQSEMLLKIIAASSKVLDFIYENSTSGADIVETCSAMMLQIMSLCLLGDTEEAASISDLAINRVESLPGWGIYLYPHTLYWASRAYISELRHQDAINCLKKAKRIKKYEFNIRGKIERVLEDTKSRVR
jgi:tetratricopeptide (TPR) repeat protein